MTKAPVGQPGITHLPNVHSWVNAESCIHEDISPEELRRGKIYNRKYLLKTSLYCSFVLDPVLPLAGSGWLLFMTWKTHISVCGHTMKVLDASITLYLVSPSQTVDFDLGTGHSVNIIRKRLPFLLFPVHMRMVASEKRNQD